MLGNSYMTDFAHLKSKRLPSATMTMYVNGEVPKLTGVFAGESNKRYFNEMLRRAEQLAKRKAKVSVEIIKEQRDRDRELFPKYVITGWSDVNDAEGKPVAFSQVECEGFLKALDDEQFDEVREYFKDVTNFREIMNPEIVAGNSQTA